MNTLKFNFLVLIVVLVTGACSNLKKSASLNNVVDINYHSPNGDSIITEKCDTGIRRVYDMNYIAQIESVQFFSPFFEKQICPPGDYSNPFYKNFVKKANRLATLAKQSFLKRGAFDTTGNHMIEQKLGNINEIMNCRMVVIPVYYLTTNVVKYKQGDNLTSFFTLDTLTINYQVYKDDKFIAMIGYQAHNFVGLSNFNEFGILSYNKVLRLKKNPIGIMDEIPSPLMRRSGGIMFFGYVSHKHLVYVLSSEQNAIMTDGHKNQQVYLRTNILQTVDAYYSSTEFDPPLLTQRLESAKYDFVDQAGHY